jgi:hypothetical protein
MQHKISGIKLTRFVNYQQISCSDSVDLQFLHFKFLKIYFLNKIFRPDIKNVRVESTRMRAILPLMRVIFTLGRVKITLMFVAITLERVF